MEAHRVRAACPHEHTFSTTNTSYGVGHGLTWTNTPDSQYFRVSNIATSSQTITLARDQDKDQDKYRYHIFFRSYPSKERSSACYLVLLFAFHLFKNSPHCGHSKIVDILYTSIIVGRIYFLDCAFGFDTESISLFFLSDLGTFCLRDDSKTIDVGRDIFSLMMDAIVFLIEAGQVCFLVKAIWT
jgi:hypothetical protein